VLTGNQYAMKNRAEVVHYLRDHIVGAMHIGQLHPGDRLPSIRETAEQLGKNGRTVKAAYEVLQQEGIVEIRERSGVYVATQDGLGTDVSEETSRWMSEFLAEAWKRRIRIPALAEEVHRFTRRRAIRCGLVETLEDGIVALRYELQNDWGFEVQVIEPDKVAEATTVDLFAATSFFAPGIHAVVEQLAKPLIVLTINTWLQTAINEAISSRQLTVVAADARFGDRVRAAYAPDAPEKIRLVVASDREAIARIDPDVPILLTRAARQVLGHAPAPMIYPHSPTLSHETARALSKLVVRMNIGPS
jgi:DNA-binding transcriptional regulator YhcF (GntR family)